MFPDERQAFNETDTSKAADHNSDTADQCQITAATHVTVTFFDDFAALTKREASLTIAELVDLIEQTTAATKEQLPWLKCAIFGNERSQVRNSRGKPSMSLRHDKNVKLITGVEGDYDGEVKSLDDAVAALREHGIGGIVYSSPRHCAERPRWRVVCPFDHPIRPELRTRMMDRLNGAAGDILQC